MESECGSSQRSMPGAIFYFNAMPSYCGLFSWYKHACSADMLHVCRRGMVLPSMHSCSSAMLHAGNATFRPERLPDSGLLSTSWPSLTGAWLVCLPQV